MIRTAVITTGDVDRVERFLPMNYVVLSHDENTVTIQGTDNAGWTLDGYVLPRLASGLLFGIEVIDIATMDLDECPEDLRRRVRAGCVVSAPRCDMFATCEHPVTMLDQKGYVYCDGHGLARRNWMPCRKLRPHEVKRLARGETIARY